MYGTVSRNRVKPGKRDEFMQRMRELSDDRPSGASQLLILKSEADPNELWVAAAFESKEVYRQNADSPEMNQRYERMMEYLEGPPEWHDGEMIKPW